LHTCPVPDDADPIQQSGPRAVPLQYIAHARAQNLATGSSASHTRRRVRGLCPAWRETSAWTVVVGGSEDRNGWGIRPLSRADSILGLGYWDSCIRWQRFRTSTSEKTLYALDRFAKFVRREKNVSHWYRDRCPIATRYQSCITALSQAHQNPRLTH
jgi:hypothetical protein